jgi:ATP-dependent Lhr-like helicase
MRPAQLRIPFVRSRLATVAAPLYVDRMTPPDLFHPAVASWFARTFSGPTTAQSRAWPAIKAGRHVLVAAPTGSGKTLAAFLAAIDDLIREGVEGELPDETFVVYVSPLKALSNDIRRNLEAPLAGIREDLVALGYPDVEIRTLVRTGDTPQSERASMRRRPPQIVVTTPESLYVLLGSESGRKMLSTTRTVIVDEIHALAPNKRGSHLALSLERLAALTLAATGRAPVRIGLSATQKPIGEVARYLTGTSASAADCTIVDVGHVRERDLALEVPPAPLEAIMSGEVWQQVYARLAALAQEHRTTLVFVNTRRMAERVARHLSELIGSDVVTAHHGSLAKERRFDAEQRLKSGALRALVATASLELGIDIGDVELVCQLGTPRSIATFLQRAGRANHSVGGQPKARLFPLSRDELVECAALLDAVRRGELDRLSIPPKPLDVLAQQIVAEVAAAEWSEGALFDVFTRAEPYATLTRDEYMSVVRMVAEGFTTRRGHRAAYIHRDAVNGVLRGRRGARITALTSGGAIPDTADYDVVLEPAGQLVGTVNEDFAIESLAGDIFQLGNASYRILRVEAGRIRVDDAQGQPPTIPFWLGEAPGRTNELSAAVSRLREDVEARMVDANEEASDNTPVRDYLRRELWLAPSPAEQLAEYLAAARAALGTLPTQKTIVFERFFDESGGMQFVIHSPFGSRINRAWGLALRKRFCRKFNFELQAAATEDAIVLSLSTTHSFPLDEVARYLHSASVRPLLIQAMCAAPMFVARWRWVATTSLALPRFRSGKKVPPQLQRMAAEDLLAAVFPDQIACPENLSGPLQLPDHPLVNQTVHDCLYDAMDIDGLENLLRALESGAIRIEYRELTEPSPLALEILGARPYAFLDDAPLEERRTRAVMSRRWLDEESAAGLGRLDTAAIDRVRAEAWPTAENADELHDALLGIAFVTQAEVAGNEPWQQFLATLMEAKRVTKLVPQRAESAAASGGLWVAAERLPQFAAVFPTARLSPPIAAPAEFAAQTWTADGALVEIVRGRLQGLGPVSVTALAQSMALPASDVEIALAKLAGEGFAMKGSFTPGAAEGEWCDRALLARIHRYTVKRLRAEIEPVTSQDFMRFLCRWQHVVPSERREGPDALAALITQLEGFEAPAAAWEADILPARLDNYDFTWLDDLCLAGRAAWTRLTAPARVAAKSAGPIRTTPVALVPRRTLGLWNRAVPAPAEPPVTSPRATRVLEHLRGHGASFFDEIVDATGLLRTQAEEALAELVALGLVHSDSFSGLRALLTPSDRRKPLGDGRRRRRTSLFGIEDAGRWALVRRPAASVGTSVGTSGGTTGGSEGGAYRPELEIVDHIADTLLRRYGVVFWRLLEREAAWLPPWRELLRVFRRLEARGEIRGGRFVSAISGEQFALPEAVDLLRETRRAAAASVGTHTWISLSAADPLNVIGSIVPGPKVPALTHNRILYRNGLPIAALVAGEVEWIEALEPRDKAEAENALVKRVTGSPLLAYLR